MLCDWSPEDPSEFDHQVYEMVAPQEHHLRLKDASHVIADIAVPTTLALVAQARDKLLAAAEPFAAVRVEGERTLIFGDVLVRVNPDYRLAMHLDTDEANAAGIRTGMEGFLLSVQDRR